MLNVNNVELNYAIVKFGTRVIEGPIEDCSVFDCNMTYVKIRGISYYTSSVNVLLMHKEGL